MRVSPLVGPGVDQPDRTGFGSPDVLYRVCGIRPSGTATAGKHGSG